MQKHYLPFLFFVCFLGLSVSKIYAEAYSYSIMETEYGSPTNNNLEFLQLEINKQNEYAYADYAQRMPFEELDITTASPGGWDPKPGEPEWEDAPVGSRIICFFLFIGIYLTYIGVKKTKA